MPFEELETLTRDNMPPEATVSYDYFSRGGERKPDKKPRLTITIPTTLCGVAKSKRFKLLLGTGQDAGKLLIRGELCYRTAAEVAKAGAKPLPGSIAPSEHAHFLKFNFGFVPKLGDETFEGQKRPVRKVSDEEFEVSVPPSWFEVEG